MRRLLAALTLLASPSLAQTYDPVLIPAQALGSPTNMTPLRLGDDSTAQVQLSFPFEYFGQTFTSAWVSSNGFVSFQSPANLCCNGQPMEQAQRNTIYGYWTDLIGGNNPYVSLTESGALFGWYSTNEYGTQNKVNFEISLAPSGAIQFNYGALANTYHTVSAGITGPSVDDNIQLFFGTNVANLSFQSGLLTPSAPEPPPEPEPTPVDCATQPDAPECVQSYSPVAVVAETVAQTDTAAETVSETVVEAAAETPVEVAPEEAQTETPAVEAPAEPEAETKVEAERLSPDEVMALSAASDGAQQEETTDASTPAEAAQDVSAAQVVVIEAPLPPTSQVVDSAAQQQQTAASDSTAQSSAVSAAPLGTVKQGLTLETQEASAPTEQITPLTVQEAEQAITEELHSGFQQANKEDEIIVPMVEQPMLQQDFAASQATTMVLLNTPTTSSPMATTPNTGETSDDSAMVNLAVAPEGYGAYSQAKIPDAAFYKPRDIYVGRKLSDANWELYRMMSSQDGKWKAMVEEQYGR